MSEYVPTTGQVRIAYSIIDGDASTSIIEQRQRAFDRWLAAHDRQLKAEGWFEATDYVSRHYEDYLPVGWSRRANEDNPYRIESQETP